MLFEQLLTAYRMRNRLLMVRTLQTELKAAAARVVRLSQPGTPERLLTLIATAEESGLRASAIVEEIQRQKSCAPAPPQAPEGRTKEQKE